MNLQETIGLVHLLHQSPYTSKTFQKASRAGFGLSYWPHFSMACRELPAQSVFSGSMSTESKILKERRGGGDSGKFERQCLDLLHAKHSPESCHRSVGVSCRNAVSQILRLPHFLRLLHHVASRLNAHRHLSLLSVFPREHSETVIYLWFLSHQPFQAV